MKLPVLRIDEERVLEEGLEDSLDVVLLGVGEVLVKHVSLYVINHSQEHSWGAC